MESRATRSRGRPRQFDEEHVLDLLTTLFWRHGYESTSVADIAEAAGLNKSSLYNTFGQKHELFARILERYIDARMRTLQSLAEASGGGIDGLHTFLEFVRAELGTEMGRNGCLAVNTSAEIGSDDLAMVNFAEIYRDRMRDTIHELVESAAESGEVNASSVDQHTDMLTIFMLGVSVIMRAGAREAEIDRFIDSAHGNIESWRT